jgi:RNA polymerase sigma factor (sigma-70 family)
MDENESHQFDSFARRDLLFETYFWLVRRAARWAKRRLPPTIEFDDLYQNASLGLLEAADRFDSTLGSRFETYATKRVYGAAIDQFRGRRYKENRTVPLRTSEIPVSPTADQQLADRDLQSIVARVLAVLGPKERTVVVLRYWCGKDFTRIALQLRIPLRRVYKLHKEALKKLKAELRRTFHFAGTWAGSRMAIAALG